MNINTPYENRNDQLYAAFHGAVCNDQMKFFHSYLGKGTSFRNWDYFAAAITFPLFDTYTSSKATLRNRLTSHHDFRNCVDMETFETALDFFAEAKPGKSVTFVPPDQIAALTTPCGLETISEAVDALFPGNAVIKVEKHVKYGVYKYQEQLHPLSMNQKPAGRVLHAKLMDRLTLFRNNDMKRLLTEAKTAIFTLALFTALKKIISIGKVYYKTNKVKAKFEHIFTTADKPFTFAGVWK